MAPFEWTGIGFIVVNLLLGIGFGAALERGGFGDSRRIAGQFYLTDLTVLKVMFTAVVVAMLLVLWAGALHLLDPAGVWIDETYLWPGILGGFLIGVGMVVGGYCPGTSLVASSNLKIDAFFFIGGLVFGIVIFGEAVPHFWDFFQQAGFHGAWTLDQWLGVSKGFTAVLVTLMALFAFWGAEKLETTRERAQHPDRPWVRMVSTPMILGAMVLVLAAFGLVIVPQPGLNERMAWQAPELEKALEDRIVQIDPAELVDLMHNNQVQLVLLDVRDEGDFNLFHLLDSQRVGLAGIETLSPAVFDPQSIVVLVSNGEVRASAAWQMLRAQGVANSYILAGGINLWLELYGPYSHTPPHPVPTPVPRPASRSGEPMRYTFPAALGDRIDIAWPDPHQMHFPERSYTPRAKVLKPVTLAGGGCG